MSAYYNENDAFAAAWLRELIKANLIEDGEVDERDIRDVCPNDLRRFTQCHFFAGIGVWSYALRRAGWSSDRRVWTGSCPCQSFSAAGKGTGFADERHLWPSWFHLIEQCKPNVIFGEQVTAAIKHGWLNLVQDDLEGIGYAVAPHGLAACNLGAPHQRKRLYFVADSRRECGSGRRDLRDVGSPPFNDENSCEERQWVRNPFDYGSTNDLLADVQSERCGEARTSGGRPTERLSDSREPSIVAHDADPRLEGSAGTGVQGNVDGSAGNSPNDRLANNNNKGLEGRGRTESPSEFAIGSGGLVNGFWSDAEWIYCRDEKYRPIEPGSFPLVTRASNRVGRLRGYGNALVGPCAEAFIRAYLECQKPAIS